MESFIEFPVFDGVSGNLKHWILWLEEFFVRERFTAMEKMNLAQSLLEGEAESWFYSLKRSIFRSWEHLIDLMIWWFGDVNEFGDFIDPELLRLWDKNARILQARRVEKRRKRMETTSLNPHESISSPATLHEPVPVAKVSNQQVEEISAEKKESKQDVDLSMEKIASQLKLPNTKVHVSDSENLRNMETRIENSVLDNFESVVMEAKIQPNIRMDMVNGDVEQIQCVMSIPKNVSAHQVLDKMCQLKSLKPKNMRKLSLSLKTWKFKFKNKMLQRNRSQMDLHQVIDISQVNNLSLCVSANFGLVRKTRTFQCLRLKKQAHKSRVLYQMRMLHDPGGKKAEHSDAVFATEVDLDNVQRTLLDIVAASGITAPDNVASSSNDAAPSTDVITKRQTPACAVVKYSEPATYAQAMQTEGWDEACDAAIDALEGTGTCNFTSLPARCGWLVFDRGKNGQIQWTEIQMISLYKEMVAVPVKQVVLNLVTKAARFGFVSVLGQTHAVHFDVKEAFMRNQELTRSLKFTVDKFGSFNKTRLTVWRVLCLLGTLFWSLSFKKKKFGKDWWYKFKHSLWQRECGRGLLEEEVSMPATVGRDALANSWMYSMAFVQPYHAFKLVDKLVFGEGSIDTFGQEEVVTWQVIHNQVKLWNKSEGLPFRRWSWEAR